MKKSAVIVNDLFLAGGILCLLFYFACGLTVRFGQSLLFLWLLLGLAMVGRYFLWRWAWAKGRPAPFPRWLLILERTLICLGLAVFLYGESFIVSAALQRAPDDLDALVVLGARVNEDGPSGSLRERIEAAEDYLRRNPDTLAVASGGQGEDEPMSEAACIRERLIAAGIDPSRITLEDRSSSTLENLSNSFALLPEGVHTVGIVTNDFHVFRALALGNKLGGYELSGVPARSSVSGFIHYAMREFFASAVLFLQGHI
ncbi:MAG: YdcF family protein [Oscillospiraceae bacterium]|nr:YdcF family protein [Oscillospiraceae bacterium]